MTAKVVTIFNQKGGCGKTTLAMNLAGAIGIRNFRVLLVDMDPQGTALRWAGGNDVEPASQTAEGQGQEQAEDETESPFPASVVSLAAMEGKMHREVRNHMEINDVIIIDCPPSMNSAAPSSAMLISDLALIPVVPSPGDIWAALGAKRLAEAAQVTNETLKAFVVANMVQRTTSLAVDMMELLKKDKDFPPLNSTLGSRTAFREAQIRGSSVHMVPRSLSQAAVDEVEEMTDEVLGLLRLPRVKKGA